MTRRRPESAPRCPHCGYSLYGLPRLRCPECGWMPSDADDVSRARWLADDNAADRAAVRNEWIAAIVWTVLIVAGVALGTLAVYRWSGRGLPGNYYLRQEFGVGAFATVGYLIYRVRIGEPMYRVLLILGSLWLVYGLVMLLS